MKHQIQHVGQGQFGPIYEGLQGSAAVIFLISEKKGEIKNAFFHKEIGTIDLVWDSGEGKGLISILEDHPDAIPFLDQIIQNSDVYSKTSNRVRLVIDLGDRNGIAIVRLDFDGAAKNWILTGFIQEKRKREK